MVSATGYHRNDNETETELKTKFTLITAVIGACTVGLVAPQVTLAGDHGGSHGSIEGVTWQLDTLLDGDVASSVPVGVRTPTVTVNAGALALDAGCNTGSGDVAVGDDELAIGPLIMTVMLCDESSMGVENHVLGVLTGTVDYDVDHRRLTIMNGDDGLILHPA